jgi:predicted transcriptional regulator of viral defense system
VLDVFRDANEPLTPKSVTEQLESVTNSAGVSQSQSHFSHSAVRKILSRMAENGDLVRLKFGKYTLPQGQCHTVTVPGENDPDGRSVKV